MWGLGRLDPPTQLEGALLGFMPILAHSRYSQPHLPECHIDASYSCQSALATATTKPVNGLFQDNLGKLVPER